MAIVNLKDVEVVSIFSKGFRVVEKSTGRDNAEYKTRWTVWSDTLGVREGDVVSLSGFLGAKVSEWVKDGDTRHSVELSLNAPRMAERNGQDAAPEQSAPEAPADPWASTPITEPPAEDPWHAGPTVDAYSEETPF